MNNEDPPKTTSAEVDPKIHIIHGLPDPNVLARTIYGLPPDASDEELEAAKRKTSAEVDRIVKEE